ncbi:MAG TPA: NAD-dependent epimerase/dehydratase family protein [Candidatus Saccharimonadales bacterium]
MKLLITGGHGFLGKHVISEFEKHNYIVFTQLKDLENHQNTKNIIWSPNRQELDLTNACNSNEWTNSYQPDVIVHMAALMGGIMANRLRPADFMLENVQMAINIMVACHKSNCKKFYGIGSVCAYPKHCPVPFKEDDLWNGMPEETNAPYGASKRFLMMLQQGYRQQYDIGGAHFLLVNLYGEHDNFNSLTSHVIPALIKKCLHAKENNLPIVEVWGSGSATREFLHARSAAQAIVKSVLMNLDTPLPINLGVGKDISIKELANLIAELTEFSGQLVFNHDLDGQPKRLLDTSRAKELIDWEDKTDFKEGLKNVIKWYRGQQS